jgi:hypothetical protein
MGCKARPCLKTKQHTHTHTHTHKTNKNTDREVAQVSLHLPATLPKTILQCLLIVAIDPWMPILCLALETFLCPPQVETWFLDLTLSFIICEHEQFIWLP